MASNEYYFISDWQLEGTVEEVSRYHHRYGFPTPLVALSISGRYRASARLERWNREGRPATHSRLASLLPRLDTAGHGVRHPYGFSLDAEGDFNGSGIWDSFKTALASLFAMIGKSGLTSHCSDSLLCVQTSLRSQPSLGYGTRRKSLKLEIARRRARTQTSWPACPCHQDRQDFRHWCCGWPAPLLVLAGGLVHLRCFGVRRRGKSP